MDKATITKFTELLSTVNSRLAKIWEKEEGDLLIEVRKDNGILKAKIKGGEVDRIV